MNELFLFVRPPRLLWPFNSPASAFWPPLAFASLAAALREQARDLRVEILDAPALHLGWRSLAAEIRRRQPTYVGLGEEAVSCAEGLRLAALAKACGATVIAGGCFFGHVAPEAIRTGKIDVVVHGEGEATIVELVEALRSRQRSDLSRVAGISFAEGEEIVRTPARPLTTDLDRLPFPAYDLLPVERYGAESRNHPRLAAIELSRGCVGACEFCVLWRQMGRVVAGQPVARLRVKSPERLLEEVRILVHRFRRRYLGWVDPCFNAHPQVPGQLAELLLRNGLQLGQSAWVRADGIVRDAASGALASCVRAGLNEVYLGIERPDAESLRKLNKNAGVEEARQAMRILWRQFPQVFTVGSFIYGLPGDTPATIRAIYRLALELELDKAFFIPLTPLPGTPFWKPEFWDPTGARFRQFNFLPGCSASNGRRRLDWTLLACFALCWPPVRLRSYLKGLLSQDARKRRLTGRVLARSTRFVAARLAQAVTGRGPADGMLVPKWYES
jgi:tRNA A37 methylthiotransferase MiaB